MNVVFAHDCRPARALALVALVPLLLAAPAPLRADGPSRPATDKEEGFHARIATTFSRALPPGPAGWAERRDTIEPLGRVIPDAEKYPLRVAFGASWTDIKRGREAQQKQADAMTKVAATPDQDLQSLMRENEKLARDLGAAINKGDQAGIARINKQLEALQAKMQKLVAAQDARMKEATRSTSAHDVQLLVSLTANTFSESFQREGASESAIGGGLVYRTQGETASDGGWREGATYVFLGKGWQLKSDGGARMEAPQRAGAPALAVQTIVVRVEGDPARANALLERIDWPSLQKLLAD